ncbi:SPFH domain / Band 7 family protein [Gimesia panareensis]|uniref:SPFH domain / Band 7 family protein n=1 Tax=Gimesia panareensis TaxID=2527978 RepID=A0A518FVW6_9PLAN|nr:SPFH domain-containing protein [Gimesia panareensis]QDV20475.1 SPFH domain / Band 7 family protein [Gimesia panareensis]
MSIFSKLTIKAKAVLQWLTRGVFARVVVGLLLVVFAVSTTKINHDELAILTRFGKNVERPLEPGLHFIFPFFHEVRRYDTRRQFLLITDMSVSPDKDFQEVLYQEGISAVTKDNVDAKIVLEVTYSIQKDKCTIDKFVSTFGRSQTTEGVRKIEKLIADTTRKLTRMLVNNVELEDAERRHVEFSRIILDFSNGDKRDTIHLPEDIEKNIESNFRNLNELPLSEIGIKIHTLGYRIQPSHEFEISRRTAAIELESQRSRLTIAEEKIKADEAEHKRMLADMLGAIELAKLESEKFSMLPDSNRSKILLKVIEKWDGRMPMVVGASSKDLLIHLSDLLNHPKTDNSPE